MNDRSLEEILRIGENLYLTKFKTELEENHDGEYAAIDAETEDYIVKESKLEAITEARKKFEGRLVYVVQVGSLEKSTLNYRSHKHVAWEL